MSRLLRHFSTSTSSSVDKPDIEKTTEPEDLFRTTIAEVTGDEFDDPNYDSDSITLEDESPYPEVRSAVANTDDPEMTVSSLRTWVIGFCWAILIPGLNQFFYFRYPSVTVSGLVALLLSFPIGRAWARLMPRKTVFGISLNPGPFTLKEHVMITIMATVGATSAYATDIIAVQRKFYGQKYNFGYQWMVVMSTQLIGFSVGGILKRFLVSPPSMIWPANLVLCALFNTLHSQEYAGIGNHGGINRERFFVIAFSAAFAWTFIPGYLFTALSQFSWVTWIAPKNAKINQMFGYTSGLGMSVITFDWAQIAYIGSPLATPWWAEANVAAGFLFFFWLLAPILYYSNAWNSQFLPMSTRGAYDNTGAAYQLSRIINKDTTFDEDAYHAYSPVFLSMTFALSYGISFASITATIVHTLLYFRQQIWMQSRRSLSEQPDIHARLMNRYAQVPEWWYMCIFVLMFTFGVITIEVWNTQMPVWAFVIALIVSFLYTIPIGMIQAITNQQIGLNVVTELIIGYALPGRPIAMMLFKTWGYITMAQALQYTSDFKMGHYMKIPPRPMFWCQVLAAVVAGTTQLGVQSWMFEHIPDICELHQKDGFSCPSTEVFGTASILWGVIGPALQFSKGQVYYALVWFFLIGAIAPIIPWLITKKYPNCFFKYVNLPIIFAGTNNMPPASAVNFVPWTIVGFIFQYFIRRRHFSWWTKYNYVLSAALDSGLAIGLIVIFFCLQYPLNGTIGGKTLGQWWGNTVYKRTGDYQDVSLRTLGEGDVAFGPLAW